MPAIIEERLKLSPYVSNVMVYGANRPRNVALVIPDREAITSWARSHGLEITDPVHDPRVRELIRGEIDRLGSELKGFERVADFELLEGDFSIEDGTLTPTFKLRRRAIIEGHEAELESLYQVRAESEAAPG